MKTITVAQCLLIKFRSFEKMSKNENETYRENNSQAF